MAQNDYYLMHYGVRGMKWGVRRTPEQLGYRSSQMTSAGKAALGRSTNVAKKFAKASGNKIREKISDPDFQRKVATGAKIALAIGAAYATHKLVNNPQAIAAGKKLVEGAIKGSGAMKASVLNSTEFKVAKAGVGVAKKGLDVVRSDTFRNTMTGIGAVATTAKIIKSQVKDLKENKPDGDRFDKVADNAEKISSIGENINTLARIQTPSSSSSNSKKSGGGNKSVGKDITDKLGAPSKKGIDKQSKEYQDLFKGEDSDTRSTIKSLAAAGYDIDQIKEYKKTLKHSDLRGSYLMHYGVKGMKWGVRKEYIPKGRKGADKDDGVIDFMLDNPKFTIYATVTAAMLARFGVKRISDLKKQGWFTEKYTSEDVGKCNTTKEEDIKIINPLKGVSESTIEKLPYLKSINDLSKPEQEEMTAAMKDGWMDNCVYCTTAGMLRRKGYDVEAKNSPGRGHSAEQTMNWWKDSKVENFYGQSETKPKKAFDVQSDAMDRAANDTSTNDEFVAHMSKTLQSQGVGAYGDLRIHGFFCGHSTEYSVEKDGVKIHDNQVRHTYDLDEYMKIHDYFDPHLSYFIRLDNCEPDLDRILKEHAVKPRGK